MPTITKRHVEDGVNSVAIYSECELYRYTLTRTWSKKVVRRIAFIGLNPSTATELQNDPTVARCMNYAHDWGYDECTMLNAFGFRATDPKVMKEQEDPVGTDNDLYIKKIVLKADQVVCCWGNHAAHHDRSETLLSLLKSWNRPLHCLTLTKSNQPGHPLYLRKDAKPFEFSV